MGSHQCQIQIIDHPTRVQINHQSNHRFRDQIQDQTNVPISDQIKDQIKDQTRDQIKVSTSSLTNRHTRVQINNQTKATNNHHSASEMEDNIMTIKEEMGTKDNKIVIPNLTTSIRVKILAINLLTTKLEINSFHLLRILIQLPSLDFTIKMACLAIRIFNTTSLILR